MIHISYSWRLVIEVHPTDLMGREVHPTRIMGRVVHPNMIMGRVVHPVYYSSIQKTPCVLMLIVLEKGFVLEE